MDTSLQQTCSFHIYAILNIVDDHIYIGQSMIPKDRFRAHRNALKAARHANCHLQRAWVRDGELAFEWFLIGEYSTKTDVDEAEAFYVEWYRTLNLSYNFREGGEGGGRLSEQTKKKISNSLIGHATLPETRQKISNALKGVPNTSFKGKVHSVETKQKISASRKLKPNGCFGRKVSEETRSKLSLANKGRTAWNKGKAMAVGTKEKLKSTFFSQGHSTWNKGQSHSDETRQKMRSAKLGTKLSETTREKMREAQRLRRERERGV